MSDNRPNVVVLVLDTARQDEVLATRSGRATTPFVEELAADGTTYDQAFTPAPWTLPAHASLFTGTYPSKHGAHAGHKRLETELPTLPELFRSDGYETVGVSNNTWVSEEFGFGRGFEILHKTWQYVQTENDLGQIARTEEGWKKIRSLADALVDGNPIVNIANAVYGRFLRKQNDSGAKQTNNWIEGWLGERNTESPFFLFVNYLEPHLPYTPQETYARRFLPDNVDYSTAMAVSQDAWAYLAGKTDHTQQDFEILRSLYRAEIAYLDDRLRELQASLEAAGEWDDTILVITGDHGENIGHHGFMDHQYCLYDTLLHVPLVIRGGPFSGGGTNDDLVQLTDIFPTLLDVAEIDAPDAKEAVQGQSFHPGKTSASREKIIAEYLAPQPSMQALESRVGTLPEDVYEYDRALRTVRTTESKLIRSSDGTMEFYDIHSDPSETTNIADAQPDSVNRLSEQIDEWLSTFDHADHTGEVSMSDLTRKRLEDLGYLQ